MKAIKYFLIFTALFIQNVFSLQAQNTEGKEFWVTFGSIVGFPMNPSIANNFDFQIRVVGGSQQTQINIYFTALDTTVTSTIEPYEVYTYILSNTEKFAVYNETTGITNYSIRITATNLVSAYAFRRFIQYSEVTNLLPVTALGTEYYQISYKNSNHSDAYTVVATQNNTHLYHNGLLEAILQEGSVYYKTTGVDMTGAHITSNNPVALFAQHKGTLIPGGYVDIIFQQLAPVNTWGKTFFVPFAACEDERIRIVALKNNTNITQTGGTIKTDSPGAQNSLTGLNASDFVELEMQLNSNGCHITANYPIGVCSYMRSYGNCPLTSTAQTWIPALEQTVSKVKMAPFIPAVTVQPSPLAKHHAVVVTSTDKRDSTKVSIGGALPTNLNGGNWFPNSASGKSFYNMPLTNPASSYIFSNPNGVVVYGYGTHSGLPLEGYASYYYLAGSAMRDLDAYFTANDIHYQDLKDNQFCEDTVHFHAIIEGLHPSHPDRITWWIDGVEYLPAKTLNSWSKHFSAGTYEIRMDVIYDNNETASKTGTLILKSCNQSAAFFANNILHSELKDTTFCNRNVNFRAEIEGLHPTAPDSIMWYINDVFETSQATWNKTFENGTYEIKLVVHYDNDTYATLTGTLKVQALWIKIRNVRY